MFITRETYTLPRDESVVHAIKDCREWGAKDIQHVGETDTTVTLEVTWADTAAHHAHHTNES